jgi:hypothetical protein
MSAPASGRVLRLTREQTAIIAPDLRFGFVLLGRIIREPFDGSNGATSGSLMLEYGSVPEASLPALRQAIRDAAGNGQSTAKSRKPRKPKA